MQKWPGADTGLMHSDTSTKKYLEEMDEALDSFFKTRIQDRTIYCKDTADSAWNKLKGSAAY